MGESRRSKSQSSLCRLGAVHHNNGLMSKHTARLMNKLFVPRNSFSLLKFGEKKKKKSRTVTSLHKSQKGGGLEREHDSNFLCICVCVCALDPL